MRSRNYFILLKHFSFKQFFGNFLKVLSVIFKRNFNAFLIKLKNFVSLSFYYFLLKINYDALLEKNDNLHYDNWSFILVRRDISSSSINKSESNIKFGLGANGHHTYRRWKIMKETNLLVNQTKSENLLKWASIKIIKIILNRYSIRQK